MIEKTPWKYFLSCLLFFLILLSHFPATDAFSSPLLEQLVLMRDPGARGFLTMLDIFAVVLLMALYFRIKKRT